MKIKHLIASLQTFDPNAEVRGECRNKDDEWSSCINLEVSFLYLERNWVTDKTDAVLVMQEVE